MFKRLKQYFLANLNCYKHNIYGYFCPDCSLKLFNPTAFLENLWDEKYKMYKMYIRCDNCSITTPAFENIKKVQDSWDDIFVKKEIELFQDV